ncbi:MAG: hypothetical protein QXP45_02675 [Thermoproteota archaeon]
MDGVNDIINEVWRLLKSYPHWALIIFFLFFGGLLYLFDHEDTLTPWTSVLSALISAGATILMLLALANFHFI